MLRRAAVAAVAAVLALAVRCPSAEAQRPSRAETVARLDSLSRAFVAGRQTPGLSVFVLRGADTLLLRGYGYANLEDSVPATPRTVYRIGSLTKQFTAALVMQQVQEGRIALDDTIQRFLPAYPTQGHRVTIRHLLTHTSGIKSYTSLGAEWRRVWRLDLPTDTLMAMFASKPFDFAPGDRYLYNNSGYYLLGVILERVTGRTYQQLVQERLAQPLGLADTRYCSTEPIVPRRAQGYATAPSGFANAEWISMTQPFAAGALCSSVLDLVTWTRALWAGRVVQPGSLQEMTTRARLNGGTVSRYGFGLGMDSLSGHFRVSHGGGINGFTSVLAYFPDDTLTIAVLDNGEEALPGQLLDRLARVALGLPAPSARQDLPLTAAERTMYVGTYGVGPRAFRVVDREGHLTIAPESEGGGTPLLHQGNHRFIWEMESALEVEFQVENGRAMGLVLRGEGGRTIRFPRAN